MRYRVTDKKCIKCDERLLQVPKSKVLFFCVTWTCEKFGIPTVIHNGNVNYFMYRERVKVK